MAKYELKTKVTTESVDEFINNIPDEQKREDSKKIVKMMQEIIVEEPKMWGGSIIGLGHYHYRYDTGHEGDMPKLAFSPRKNALTCYLAHYLDEENSVEYKKLFAKLGKHEIGKSCLYIKKLSDVDADTLMELFKLSLKSVDKIYKSEIGNN